jgi:hypothetical protein
MFLISTLFATIFCLRFPKTDDDVTIAARFQAGAEHRASFGRCYRKADRPDVAVRVEHRDFAPAVAEILRRLHDRRAAALGEFSTLIRVDARKAQFRAGTAHGRRHQKRVERMVVVRVIGSSMKSMPVPHQQVH